MICFPLNISLTNMSCLDTDLMCMNIFFIVCILNSFHLLHFFCLTWVWKRGLDKFSYLNPPSKPVHIPLTSDFDLLILLSSPWFVVVIVSSNIFKLAFPNYSCFILSVFPSLVIELQYRAILSMHPLYTYMSGLCPCSMDATVGCPHQR